MFWSLLVVLDQRGTFEDRLAQWIDFGLPFSVIVRIGTTAFDARLRECAQANTSS
jgi:hypothetical protein